MGEDLGLKEYHRVKSAEWYKQNKNRQRENVKRDYYKNKIKWQSRKATRILLKKGSIKLYKICKHCGRKIYLQIHHEIYPIKKQEIIQAVNEGKIYFLCKKCHYEKRKVF